MDPVSQSPALPRSLLCPWARAGSAGMPFSGRTRSIQTGRQGNALRIPVSAGPAWTVALGSRDPRETGRGTQRPWQPGCPRCSHGGSAGRSLRQASGLAQCPSRARPSQCAPSAGSPAGPSSRASCFPGHLTTALQPCLVGRFPLNFWLDFLRHAQCKSSLLTWSVSISVFV